MTGAVCERLKSENLLFANSGGISQNNQQEGFLPAFMDSQTGEIALSRFKNGQMAPFHLMDGLPETWLYFDESSERVVDIKQHIVSGFVRYGRFFSRQEAADFMAKSA